MPGGCRAQEGLCGHPVDQGAAAAQMQPPSLGHALCTLVARPLLSGLDLAPLIDGKAGEALPRDGHVHEKENKRCFSKHTIYFGRPCKESIVLRGGMLLGLGVSPEAGVEEGDKERETGACTSRHLQIMVHPGRLKRQVWGCSHGAGAIWEDAVGPRC